MIPALGQNRAPRHLEMGRPTRPILGEMKPEMPLPDPGPTPAAFSPRQALAYRLEGMVGRIALQQAERQLSRRIGQPVNEFEVAVKMGMRILDRRQYQDERLAHRGRS